MAEIRLSSAQAGRQWRDLAKRLRKDVAAEDLRKNLRKRIQAAGKPVVQDVQDAVRTLRVTGSHGGGGMQRSRYRASRARTEKAAGRALRRRTGLRDAIAKATSLQVTNRGVRIVTRVNQLPENQRTLPRHLDSDKGWRHPVFGNRENWVGQKGGPWFAETIKKKAPDLRNAVVQAMEDARAELER